MATTPARPYNSPARRRQADATRTQILDAARTLLAAHGYDGATVDAIARAAGVAVPTVYAAFGSKRGIVAELMDRARFGPAYEAAVAGALASTDPARRLALVARVARTIYTAERAEFDALRGLGAVAPELAALQREAEDRRRVAQRPVIDDLADAHRLRPDLDREAARDILWTLTARETYRLLVVEREWSADRYEAWLAELLTTSLLAPVKAAASPRKPAAKPKPGPRSKR
jgi:TetR/AcrR family transcriptional regulator, regulator of cefoperazone and chloramphenicol sensitivity